jgi:sugar phosphate isomerase/epimerase
MIRGSTITLDDYPLEQAIDIFRAAGFTGLEMWVHHLKKCKTPELRQRFAQESRTSGIAMGGLNVVGEDYFRPFGLHSDLEVTLEGLRSDVEFARSLGTRDVLIWEGRAPAGTDETFWLDRLLPRLTEVLKAAVDFAKPHGMRFLAEPHPFTVGMSDRFLKKLCDALDSEHFGITYDFCHYGVGRPNDYLESIRNLGEHIRHIHFSDTDKETSELHFPPGSGRLDIPAMLTAFRDIGYRGTMTLDLYGYPMAAGALRGCVTEMRRACEFLGIEG